MSAIVRFLNFVDGWIKCIGKFGSLLILALIAVTVFDVVTRKIDFLGRLILESPLSEFLSPTKMQELEWHLHASIFLLGFGFAYLSNAHVRVDLFRETLAPRKQMIVELLGLCLLALPYVGVLIYFSWDFVHSSYVQQETSVAMTGLPYRWIIKSVFLAGMVLLCLSIISTILRVIIILCHRSDSLAVAVQMAGSSLDELHVLAHKQEDEVIAEFGVVEPSDVKAIDTNVTERDH